MGSNFRRQKRYSNVWLPCELVEEILCILPVKSLLRFKTVCKSWNLLINSHDFIDKHLHRKNPQLGGYPVVKKKERTIFRVNIQHIVDVCNGIICLQTSSSEKPLVLFNSSTREFSFVPHAGPGSFFGFCYNPKTQEYLLVDFKLIRGRAYRNFDIKTLTLGKIISSRVAKKVRAPGPIISTYRHITSGTTMYWLGMDHGNDIVVCYDVIEGTFSKINMPPIPFYSPYQLKSLQVLKGSVIMFVSRIDGFAFFDMWMLIDDISKGKSWMKYRTVGPLETVVYPIKVCWYDRWILCSKGSNNLFYYDLDTNQVKDYCDLQSDLVEDYKATDPPIYEFANYVESLVSIKSLVPCIDTDCPEDCLEN